MAFVTEQFLFFRLLGSKNNISLGPGSAWQNSGFVKACGGGRSEDCGNTALKNTLQMLGTQRPLAA